MHNDWTGLGAIRFSTIIDRGKWWQEPIAKKKLYLPTRNWRFNNRFWSVCIWPRNVTSKRVFPQMRIKRTEIEDYWTKDNHPCNHAPTQCKFKVRRRKLDLCLSKLLSRNGQNTFEVIVRKKRFAPYPDNLVWP